MAYPRILMALMSMEIGGAETHVLELCKALTKRGLQVYVASNGGAYESELASLGIVHCKVPMHSRKPHHILYAYFALKKIIRDNNIRLVHAHARIPGFLCGLLQKRLRFRFVTTVHRDFSTAFPFNRLSDWGELSLAVSEDLKRYLIDSYRIPTERIRITVNGIDTDKFAPGKNDTALRTLSQEYGLPLSNAGDKTWIMSINRLDEDSATAARLLVRAAETVVRRFPDAAFLIVGGGAEYDGIRHEADAVNQWYEQYERHGQHEQREQYEQHEQYEQYERHGQYERHERRWPLITMVGAQTDIPQWLAMADIFVGSSRSALEAMSAGKPVVHAGPQGFLGLLTAENRNFALATNFCYRGGEAVTEARLTDSLLAMLAKTPAERAAIGAEGRALVLTHYSVTRMTEDALAMYDKVLTLPPPPALAWRYATDVVISGYYGHNNSGDDLLLKSIVDNLRLYRPEISITVLSVRPRETRAYYGVNAIYRFNPLAVYRQLRRTSLLITGGGNVIQDGTSTHSLLYYLWVINTARRIGVKNMLYANGIGPLTKPANLERVRRALSRVDLITLRESDSLRILNELGIATAAAATAVAAAAATATTAVAATAAAATVPCVTSHEAPHEVPHEAPHEVPHEAPHTAPQAAHYPVAMPEIYVTADPVFALRPADEQDKKAALADLAGLGVDGPFFCVSIRHWKHNPPGLVQVVADFADYVVETYGYRALFVSMRPVEDTEISKRVMSLMKHPGVMLTPAAGDIDRMHSVTGFAEFVLGMRLHALIYAAEKGVPVIGLVYDPKVKHQMDAMRQRFYMPVETADTATLVHFIDEIHKNRTAITADIVEAGRASREKAFQNAALCVALLRQP